MVNCCKNCGYVTFYRSSGRYECMKQTVEPNGICDRWIKNYSPHAIMKIIDKAIKDLENQPDGKYELKKRPAFMENYRLMTAEELKG